MPELRISSHHDGNGDGDCLREREREPGRRLTTTQMPTVQSQGPETDGATASLTRDSNGEKGRQSGNRLPYLAGDGSGGVSPTNERGRML